MLITNNYKKQYNLNFKYHEQHPFHLVDIFFLFLIISISFFIIHFHYFKNGDLYAIINLCFFLSRWFFDIAYESTFEGFHIDKVQIIMFFLFFNTKLNNSEK